MYENEKLRGEDELEGSRRTPEQRAEITRLMYELGQGDVWAYIDLPLHRDIHGVESRYGAHTFQVGSIPAEGGIVELVHPASRRTFQIDPDGTRREVTAAH